MLLPLVDLDDSLKSVGVLGSDSEVVVNQVSFVLSFTCDVNQFEVVVAGGFVSLDGLDLFLSTVHALLESNNLFLILPKEDESEWNHNAPSNEFTKAIWIIILLLGRGRFTSDARSDTVSN